MNKIFYNLKQLTKNDIKSLSPQVLAFVGDSVYTLYVRTMLSGSLKYKVGKLHTLANGYVNAVDQSIVLNKISHLLNEEELRIFKSARNYKTHSIAKSATVSEYKRATGLEAVLG